MQHHVRECGVDLAIGQWQPARLAVPEFDLEAGLGCGLGTCGVEHARRVVDRYHPHPEAREFDREDACARADVCDDEVWVEQPRNRVGAQRIIVENLA